MLVMDVFHMTTKISALCESLFATRAPKWSLPGVLPKMVTKIAAFFEYAFTVSDLAFEVHFMTLGLFVPDHDCLVPVIWYAWESFRIALCMLKVFRIIRVLF